MRPGDQIGEVDRKGSRTILAVLAVPLTLPAGPAIAAHPRDLQENQAGSERVLEVLAKKYEFTPEEIHVKKGSKVRLQVHATDEEHGIKLNPYPEGSRAKSSPGLVFDDARENGKVEKGQEQILDFMALQAGT